LRSVDAALFLLFALLGVGVTAVGAFLFRRTKTFVDRAHRSSGRYVSSVRRGTVNGDGTATYPVVEFETADGRSIRFEARAAVILARRKIGKPVEVLYDPADPQQAIVDDRVEIWAPALIFAAVGIMFILFALVGFVVGLVVA
jgi:Protein of unknown function (DUF3592)